MANPIVAPDDDTTFDRVGSILALPAEIATLTRPLATIIVSPESFANYSFPVGFGSA